MLAVQMMFLAHLFQGIKTAAIVAHPDHAVRVAKVVQHFGVTAIGTPYLQQGGIAWTDFSCDELGYSNASTQVCVR